MLYSIKLLDIPLPPGKPKDTSKTKSDTIPVTKEETTVEHTERDQPLTQTAWKNKAVEIRNHVNYGLELLNDIKRVVVIVFLLDPPRGM